MPFLVTVSVVRSPLLAIVARWNDCLCALLLDLFNQRISVIAPVSNHSVSLFADEQTQCLGDIVRLSSREGKLKGIA